ncbi:AAA domain-containing protein [Paenibacillus barcinonensis]|uniref:AAA domain-containing protein n=1 Tax=Paenibacillus barcinonensis TaxID=198119 RepID=A0A2V4VEZ5_PAEBA|nr:AAA domain-containing protein [Paenibacillus barcinonensis]
MLIIKLVIFGQSGSGKSTIARIVQNYYEKQRKTVQVVKLASPLYEIQNHVYKKLLLPYKEGAQDQILLENLATNIRRISPNYLVETFMEKVNNSEANVIINDDLRDYHTDYPRLTDSGFIFIKVSCKEEIRQSRLKSRDDLSIVQNSKTTKGIQDFLYHYHIDNSNLSLLQLESSISDMLEGIK